ncbi:MAG: TIR domain-containing protein, partial [Methylobacter sp.]
MTKRFQVALSFPGEQRDYVAEVAQHLAEKLGQDQVFYDQWYQAELARPNLDTHLQTIYHDDSQLIVPFLCADYERKEWCGLEWRAIRDLIKKRNDGDIMPLRFDGTHIPGLFSIDGYIDLQKHNPKQTADLILQRLPANRPIDKSLKIHTNRLPSTLGQFFGRQSELNMLDTALADPHTHIVQFIAPGGTGKTKLLQHWLDQHTDIQVLIAWSFYSQGSSDDKQ